MQCSCMYHVDQSCYNMKGDGIILRGAQDLWSKETHNEKLRKWSSGTAKKLSTRFSGVWGLLYFQHSCAHRNLRLERRAYFYREETSESIGVTPESPSSSLSGCTITTFSGDSIRGVFYAPCQFGKHYPLITSTEGKQNHNFTTGLAHIFCKYFQLCSLCHNYSTLPLRKQL